MSERMTIRIVVHALEMAIKRKLPVDGLMAYLPISPCSKGYSGNVTSVTAAKSLTVARGLLSFAWLSRKPFLVCISASAGAYHDDKRLVRVTWSLQ
jgi:hypothetical protein